MDCWEAMLDPLLREGQKLTQGSFIKTEANPSASLFQVIIVLAGIIGFLVGFATQQLSHAIYTVLAGAALSALIVLPPWPFLFRKNPIVVCS